MRRTKVLLFCGLAILTLLAGAGCPPPWMVGIIRLQIDPAAASKGITAGDFEVTGLEIRFWGPEGEQLNTIHWNACEGSRSYLIPVREAGEHEIEVTHFGCLGKEAIEAVEASAFEVQARKITVIDIVPGGIGLIRIEE